MESQEQFVLNQLLKWLRCGDRVWLCTIVGTHGSSPRPLGSMLVLNQHGEFAGSLSGGCVEDDLLAMLLDGEDLTHPLLREYGVTAEENERLGLPCGGRLHVLIEPLAGTSAQLAHFDAIVATLSQRQCCERVVNLGSGAMQINASPRAQRLQINAMELRQGFGPRYQLLLIGAGQLAHTLAQMAQMLDYRVLVCDPRADRIAQWGLADIELICGMPDDVIRDRAYDEHSIVITLTHDPRIDDMALMEALMQPLFYVGALGSMRTTQKRRERLLQLGITPQQLARLQAPVGLDIGSKTPAEIAISILAQLTALRCGHNQRPEISPMNVGALVLAAGKSTRFGSDKRLLPAKEQRTLLEYTLDKYLSVFDSCVVVTQEKDSSIRQRLGDRNVQHIVQANADAGMGDNLALAMRHPIFATCEALAVVLADMPLVRISTLSMLKRFAQPGSIVVPAFEARRGHPVIFGRTFFEKLAQLSGDTGARQILLLHANDVIEIGVDDEGVVIDIDTQADWQRFGSNL